MHPVRNGSNAGHHIEVETEAEPRAAAAALRISRADEGPHGDAPVDDGTQRLQLSAEPCPVLEDGIRTLLFEEDAVKLRFVERVLRSRGHLVSACTNAQAALLTYCNADYPLVVLGGAFARARMLCQRLQASRAQHSVYVVIGWRDKPGDLKAALAGGADEYLPGPTDVALFNVRLASIESRVNALADRESMPLASDEDAPVRSNIETEEEPEEGSRTVPDATSTQEQEHDMKLEADTGTLHDESAARREAEGALVNIRGEMERRISQHLVERRTLVETLHLETEARRDAEHALREARMELNHRLDQHFTALAAIGNAAQVEANARLEAEIALREVRGELQRRVDLHAVEMRQLSERAQQEMAARKEAETTLRHTRGNARRRASAHRAELKALHEEVGREREARQLAEKTLNSAPVEPDRQLETLAAEIRTLTEQVEQETARRKQAEARLHDAQAELEGQINAHAQERRALAEALDRETSARAEHEHALGAQQAEQAGVHAEQIKALTAAVEQETARRELAEAAMQNATAAVHATGNNLLASVRRHLRVVANAALTLTFTNAQRALLTELLKNAEATMPTEAQETGDDGGAPQPATTAFPLRDTVRAALEPLGHRAREGGLQLAWHVAQQVPDEVSGSPLYLRQVLVNLVDNALRFTREGEVTVRFDAASWTPERVVLLVTVADSGVGIAPERQDQVFELLSRDDTVLTAAAPEGGIGLAVCAHLVRSMGGRIWFESEPDMGSTFYFTTPLRARDPAHSTATVSPGAAARPPRAPAGDPGKPCVLVADDTPEDQALAARLLEGHGYRVVAVRDGREALSALEEQPVDIALTDLRMPRMDGFELAAAIRTAESAGDGAREAMPIIALAISSGAIADRARCTAVGIDRCVTKPLQATDLLSAVEQALAQR